MDTAMLAETAAATLVTAMATDAWGRVRAATAQLLGRGERSATEAAARELDTSYQARQGDEDDARIHLRVALRARLRDDPELCAPLEELVARLGPAHAPPSQQVRVGRARNVQVAGRDIHQGRWTGLR